MSDKDETICSLIGILEETANLMRSVSLDPSTPLAVRDALNTKVVEIDKVVGNTDISEC